MHPTKMSSSAYTLAIGILASSKNRYLSLPFCTLPESGGVIAARVRCLLKVQAPFVIRLFSSADPLESALDAWADESYLLTPGPIILACMLPSALVLLHRRRFIFIEGVRMVSRSTIDG
jgi:hypothetical protein